MGLRRISFTGKVRLKIQIQIKKETSRMPTYDYSCEKCGHKTEEIHRISEKPVFKCSSCQNEMVKLISLNGTGFILKGGTPAIHYREKRQRLKKREELGKRQTARYGHLSPRIQPNIAGVETGSWSDAQKMAKEAGMNHESFTPWVEKEKKKKIVT